MATLGFDGACSWTGHPISSVCHVLSTLHFRHGHFARRLSSAHSSCLVQQAKFRTQPRLAVMGKRSKSGSRRVSFGGIMPATPSKGTSSKHGSKTGACCLLVLTLPQHAWWNMVLLLFPSSLQAPSGGACG